MKILWTGGPAWGSRGVLIVNEDGRFRAVGPGEIVEIDDERAKLLVAGGRASLDLGARDELEPMDGQELGEMTETYNAVHAKCVKGTEEAQARLAAKFVGVGGKV